MTVSAFVSLQLCRHVMCAQVRHIVMLMMLAHSMWQVNLLLSDSKQTKLSQMKHN